MSTSNTRSCRNCMLEYISVISSSRREYLEIGGKRCFESRLGFARGFSEFVNCNSISAFSFIFLTIFLDDSRSSACAFCNRRRLQIVIAFSTRIADCSALLHK
eukprot:NODE_218_length_14160_cov_0.274874.p9 type:complete len:103 gc:universal NODE_218_length_14160_cov_0.274874:9075-8767(-)